DRLRHLVGRERVAAIDQEDVVRAGGVTALLRLLEIELLADVAEHGDDLVVVVELLEPGDDAGGVQPARVGEHRGLAHLYAAPSRRCLLSSSRRSAAGVPAAGTTRMVFSPETVASTCGWFDSSIASASAAAKPRGVKTTTMLSPASIERAQRRKAAASSRRRS